MSVVYADTAPTLPSLHLVPACPGRRPRPPWRRWTPAEESHIVARTAEGARLREIAAELGRTLLGTMEHRQLIGACPTTPHCWTTAEETRLIAMLEAHVPWTSIAAQLGLSRPAVQDRAHVLGLNYRTASGYTLSELGRLLAADHKTLEMWIARGYLRSTRTRQPIGRRYYRFVEHDDLVAFLADPTHWHRYDPTRFRDLALREWATEIRGGVHFLTCREVGPLLGMAPLSVQVAIRQGRLPGVQVGARGSRWVIRSDQLRLPTCRERRGVARRPGLTAAERAFVRRWHGRRPAPWIAARLGCSDTLIWNTARALGLPGVGRGYWKRQGAKRGSGR